MQHRGSIGIVFAIVLIDMLGFGLVMPVMPGLIMELGRMSVDAAALWAGWLGAGYAALQFVFAPVIGNLSDRYGRRPVLLASLGAFGIDYLVTGFAPSLWWLVLGRLAAGITGASWSAAYAYIADISPPEQRSANFGLMGMAFGFGFIFGPVMGGFLATIGPRAPFFAAAALAFANMTLGWFVLRESLDKANRRAFDWRRANAFAALKALGRQSGAVRWYIASTGVWQLAHIVYPTMWAYVAIAAWQFDKKAIGLALGVVGVSSALVQGLGTRFVAPKLGAMGSVLLGFAGFVASALLYSLAGSVAAVYLAIMVGGLQGFIGPSISGLASKAIDAKSQGELQGASQAVGSLAAIVGPPLYSLTFARFHGAHALAQVPTMPFLLAAAISLVALALFSRGLAMAKATPIPSARS